MTRPHPFDEIFAAVAEETFPGIRDEAGAVEEMADFARAPATSTLLEQITPPGPDGEADADPLVAGGFAHLLYTLFRYWQDGQQTRVVPRVDRIPDPVPGGRGAHHPPCGPHGTYLQFPERWFWARINEDSPHEPLDGIFVAPSGDAVALTAVLGFRPERVGFSQLIAMADAAAFAAAPALVRQPAFAPVMDGGREAGFHSLVSEAELIHLTQLALAWSGE